MNGEEGQLITVMDVEGVGVSDLTGDAFSFLSAASKIVQDHYVERCHKIFIVNAPTLFSWVNFKASCSNFTILWCCCCF